jgi:hypothetical protein
VEIREVPELIQGREKEMPRNSREYFSSLERSRQGSNGREVKIPTAIRAFAWLCFFRSGMDLIFALLVGIAPKSAIAIFVVETFGGRIPHIPAEGEFFVFAFLFAFIGWKWLDRYWWIRWVAMFLSGAFALRILGFIVADRVSAAHGKILPWATELELSVIVAFNLLICGYLAFYPGVAEAFKETS